MSRKKVVILGTGFAGLQLARRISSTYDVTIVDRYNFHQFQPLFYQVATARLEPSSISFPLRKIFQSKEHVRVRISDVKQVYTERNEVVTQNETLVYDYLVIATGCTSNYFGNKNIEQHAFPMKSTTESIALRNRILLNFEDALTATPEQLKGIMNIVIVGGGPTGVELAGSLAEMKKKILPRDYPDMDFSQLGVYLLEGQGALLGAMSKASQETSLAYLEKMGVNVWLNTIVDDYDGEVVTTKEGNAIPTHTMIWAAGIKGNVPEGIAQDVLARGNRIKTDEYNKVLSSDNVFAIGDIAYMETKGWERGHPQLANVATNQGKHLAKNLNRVANGQQMQPFMYTNPGTMATVGKRKAVVDLPAFSFQGFIAWLFWMFLHLMLILSVKKKLIIFINWAVSYVTNDTTLRLILMPTRKQIELKEERLEKTN